MNERFNIFPTPEDEFEGLEGKVVRGKIGENGELEEFIFVGGGFAVRKSDYDAMQQRAAALDGYFNFVCETLGYEPKLQHQQRNFKQLEITERQLLNLVWGYNNFLYGKLNCYNESPNKFMANATRMIGNDPLYARTSDGHIYELQIDENGIIVESGQGENGVERVKKHRDMLNQLDSDIRRIELLAAEEKAPAYKADIDLRRFLRRGVEMLIDGFTKPEIYRY